MTEGRLAKFLGLPPAERRLLVRALLLVALVRVGLWLCPYGRVRGWVARAGRPRGKARGAQGAERIAWAVSTASRVVPGASCLTQALAASMLLGREGIPHAVRIGILGGRAAGAPLRAHAWVQACGRVVLGETADLGEFRELR